MFGRGAVFDAYPFADPTGRTFHSRLMAGERLRAGWVEPGDFEPEPVPEGQQAAPGTHRNAQANR